MAVVDSLEAIIESKVVDANNGIDNLIKKLDIVSQRISAIGRNDAFKGFFAQAQAISKSMSSVGAGFKNSAQSSLNSVSNSVKKIKEEMKGSRIEIIPVKEINMGMSSLELVRQKVADLERLGATTTQTYRDTVSEMKRLEEAARIKGDTSYLDKVNEKIMELKNKFEKSGIDFKFTGNFEQLNVEIEKAYSNLNKLLEKEREMISTGQVNTPEFEQLEESIAKIGNKLGIMDDLRDRTEEFYQSLQQIKLPPIHEENLTKLQNAVIKLEAYISKLRNQLSTEIAAGKIVPNIDDSGFRNLTRKIAESEKQAELLKEKIDEIGRASNTTVKSSNSLSNGLSKLSSNANLTSGSINKLTKNLGRSLSGMKSFTRSILSAAGIMGGLYGAIRGAFKSIDIASDLTEVQNVVDVTFGDFKDKIEGLADVSIPQFGMSELTAKQIASRFQAMGTAMGFAQDKMEDMSVDITKLAADMASFYNVEQEDVAKSLESIFTGTTRPLRRYGIDLTQATLQEWALKQGLDANIQSMTQAEKTMLRYQYVMAHTGAAQGDFQRTINSWHNQITILKQNFKELGGVIGGSLINAFKPFIRALNEAMTHIIAFAKTVSNALGKIFGWKYEEGGGVAMDLEDGENYAGGIADGMDKAAAAGKKLRDYVLGIDELNIIAPEEPSGGSGFGGAGGGGGVGDYGYQDAAGAWEKTESLFESSIDTLFKLGRHISDTLSNALESINWDSVYEKARNFGSGLASFLNGLISPRLFYNLGKTVANSINTAFHAANAFAITFDWKNLGDSLAKSIKGFFENWDAGLTAETFSNFAKGILQSMSSFLNTLSEDNTFEDMGQKLVDFLFGIDWAGLAWNTVEFFKALGNALIDFPTDFGNGIGEELVKKIFGEETEYQIPDTFWEKLLVGGIGTTVANQLPEKAIDEMMGGIKGENESSSVINNLMEINEIMEKIKNSAISGKASVEDLAGVISSKFSPEELGEMFRGMKDGFEQAWGEVRDWFVNTGITGLWNDDISPWFTAEKWAELGQGILDGIILKWEELKTWWGETAIVSWWEEHVAPWFTMERWHELANGIKEGIATKWNETVAQWIINITTWWNKNVSPWFTLKRWTDLLATIPEAFKNAFKNAANGAISMLNKIIDAAESMANSVISVLNSIRVDIPDWVPKFGGKSFGINLPKVSIPRIPQFEIGGFPEDGLFFANHTELVGEFSNGKTAVANNAQIVEGISIGVESAVRSAVADILAPYLADIAKNTREFADKDMSVNIGDREIARANYRGQRAMGVRLVHEM